ncbi:MAG: ATP phosphoribosyltransferase regulatory subunit [Acidobacteria bacterium]|nr:ATP phosphoribosyltransferase regulatory subunit [Acidobacteriota bacterium]MCI0622883.1 ATP phosphoribosyltransferase regulatory subunit [Acidobacteriota bacterium]MCI0720708.1 ATP phosphoribosyltransferase regulatory subunit [Acidobacteriota bacterium]
MKTLTQIPLGTQLLFGKAAKKRRRIERTIFSVFEQWDYEEIIPPIFDYYDVFTKGMGAELEDTLYRFIDREGNILALRPEFTSLVAKSVATRLAGQPKPLRLSYCGEVLRYEAPRGGRQREFFQIGVEHVGGERTKSDAEIILVAIESLKKLGIRKFQINLGEMGYFAGIVERMNFSREDLVKIKTLVDLKDTVGLRAELERLSLSEKRRNILLSLVHLTGNSGTMQTARQLVSNEKSLEALDHLAALHAELKKHKVDEHITIDLSEVRGLEYYTGTIFKIYVPGLGFEIGGGGRYDNLLKNFGCDFPSVGFSFSLERLMAMED